MHTSSPPDGVRRDAHRRLQRGRRGRAFAALLTLCSATLLGSQALRPAPAAAQVTPTFNPLSPARLLDTRPGAATIDGIGAGGGRVAAETTVDVQVTGRGGVPASGVAAVVLNVTAVDPTGSGYTTVYPTGSAVPNASSINWTAGRVVPNAVIAKVGTGGKVSVFNSGAAAHYLVDVAGWIAGDTGYTPLDPARLLDTRPGAATIDGVLAGGGTVAAGATVEVQVTGRGGVAPTGATAVVLNVTAVEPTGAGYTTVFPSGTAVPNASNLNWSAGDVVANAVTMKLGTGGKVSIFNSGAAAHYIVDVVGWFASTSTFNPLTPARLLDTRSGSATIDGNYRGLFRFFAGESSFLPVAGRGGVPATGVGAVILNVTAVDPTDTGYTTVYPNGEALPNASQLNLTKGRTVADLVVAKIGQNGAVRIYNYGAHSADYGRTITGARPHYIVDVVGWFAGTVPPGSALPPNGSAVAVSSSTLHSCTVLTDGSVRCSGDNSFGQLGSGNRLGSAFSLPVVGLTGATQIGVGDGYSCALTAGSVQCWGRADNGRLGNGTTSGVSTTPQTVSGITTATRIAVGKDSACALLADATLRCWGRNSAGELGNGTTIDAATPVAVSGLTGVTDVAVGIGALGGILATSCAVTGGRVMCWGYGIAGMNAPAGSAQTTPVATDSTSTDVVQVSVGGPHACARRSAGTVECWGDNSEGQLGDGTRTNHGTLAVPGLTGVASVSVGDYLACARITDGTVKCFGQNGSVSLGIDPTTTPRALVPTLVPGATGAASLSLSLDNPCLITANGAARCWGLGMFGANGNNSRLTYLGPTPMSLIGGTAAAAPSDAAVGGSSADPLGYAGAPTPVRLSDGGWVRRLSAN